MKGRLMPDTMYIGSEFYSPMSTAMRFRRGWDSVPNPKGLRTVNGFILPEWQRPFVWTEEQSIAFIENAWRGVPIGTYSVNLLYGSCFDGYLIDGQQRMRAIELYLDDAFPVFGYRWSEVTKVDRRVWEARIIFPYFEVSSNDEAFLREYYNVMNFGGTAHKPEEMA